MAQPQVSRHRIEKKRVLKFTKLILIAVLTVVLTMTALIIWTPLPTSWLVRSLASNTDTKNFGTPPANLSELTAQTQVISNISYPSNYSKNKLDIYLPKGDSKPLPVIIFLHGGGFVLGDKSMTTNYATTLAADGFAVLSMNYELAPNATLVDQTKQVGEVWSYLQQLAQKYPLDPSQVIFAGSSAGAFLAGQFALIQTNAEYAKLMGLPQLVPADTIKGLLLYSAPYDISEFQHLDMKPMQQFLIKRLGWIILGDKNWMKNPEFGTLNLPKYVTSDFPPTFVTDGNTGSFETQARTFVSALQEKGVPVTSLFFDPAVMKAGHGYQFDMASPASILSLETAKKFLQEVTDGNLSKQ